MCVSGGGIEWVIIWGMETQEIFFFLNRPFSKLAKLQGLVPHRYKEHSLAGHFAFARHNMCYFLNEQTLPPHTFFLLLV